MDFLTHDAGHLPEVMFGWEGNPHFGPFRILSNILIGLGFWLLALASRFRFCPNRLGRYRGVRGRVGTARQAGAGLDFIFNVAALSGASFVLTAGLVALGFLLSFGLPHLLVPGSPGSANTSEPR